MRWGLFCSDICVFFFFSQVFPEEFVSLLNKTSDEKLQVAGRICEEVARTVGFHLQAADCARSASWETPVAESTGPLDNMRLAMNNEEWVAAT